MKKLQFFAGGKWIDSKTERYMDVFNPSTGEILAKAPCCTKEEVAYAIEQAAKAYPAWSNTPVMRRVQILYKLRALIETHLDELTDLVCRENGKAWGDAEGDVLKAKEGTEHAISAPNLMMGESLMDTANGVDTTLYREPLGVFAGIVPFNFPAMIPMGWMFPICAATGNTMVIKASSSTPLTALRLAELYQEAGLPDGVLNIVTCSRSEAELLLEHPEVKGVSFVGSTGVGLHVYQNAAKNGKRVQALTEAKNHALVLDDAPISRTAAGIINAAFGCAGERCMALSAVVVQDGIADALIAEVTKLAKAMKIGAAWEKDTDMGPVVTASHKKFVTDWIETGVNEGAKLVLDGRNVTVADYEGGFFVGPTIFDEVTDEMTVGTEEIFGPVLCFKRVKNYEEGLKLINESRFANGAVIFTQSGYYARDFAKRSHAGMVGVNVGIPVPVGMFPFSGHKQSFFGDLHCLGKDGLRFFTESKCVTTRWFDEEELKREKVDSWDGTI